MKGGGLLQQEECPNHRPKDLQASQRSGRSKVGEVQGPNSGKRREP